MLCYKFKEKKYSSWFMHHAKDKIGLCRGQLTANKKKDDKHQISFTHALHSMPEQPNHVASFCTHAMPYICHYASSFCTHATTSWLVLKPPMDEQNWIDLSKRHLCVVVSLA
jgi:hypothetical protein